MQEQFKQMNERKLHVYDEGAKARLVVVWGKPGAEAVIAQLLPFNKSLFLAQMDVPGARKEAETYVKTWESTGAKVIQMRDVLAQTLMPLSGLTKDKVLQALTQKAWHFQINSFGEIGRMDPQVDQLITQLLDTDITQYGLEQALTLNTYLSLIPDIPLANMLYTRDPVAIWGNTLIISNMAKEARKPEPLLAEAAYCEILGTTKESGIQLPAFNVLRIPPEETFEGGDLIPIDSNTLSIGVEPRTSINAALFIFNRLQEQLEAGGIKTIIATSTRELSAKQQMDYMHNDTYAGPVGIGMMFCKDEAENRRIYEVEITDSGIEAVDTELNYLEYASKILKKKVRFMSEEEQEAFGVNNIIVGDGEILVPSTAKPETIAKMIALEAIPTTVDMEKLTAGYGGPHCSAQVLIRYDD